jgi:hypothetical protein
VKYWTSAPRLRHMRPRRLENGSRSLRAGQLQARPRARY